MTNETNEPPGFEQPPIELLIERIDERLLALGLNDREASIRATGRPDAIREIRRLKRPGSARMVQLAKALETTPDYLGGWVDHARGKVWLKTTQSALPLEGAKPLPRDVPVYGPALRDEIQYKRQPNATQLIEQLLYDFSKPIDFARRPPRLTARDDVYVIIVFGRSMYPRFREGNHLYIDPRVNPRQGEDAFVTFKSDEGKPSRWGMIKEYAGGHHPGDQDNPFHYEQLFRQFSPQESFGFSSPEIEIHRVIPQDELLSL